MRKNAFLTLCFALIPGCGAMYQGYMKRGVSLLFWFFAPIAVSALFYLNAVLFLLPIIWAYSFFDTFNLRARAGTENPPEPDAFLPGAVLGDGSLEGLFRNVRSSKVAGWACIGLGVLALYGTFWDAIYGWMWYVSPLAAEWMGRFPALIIAAAVIALGLRLLRGGKPPEKKEEDGIPAFKGGGQDE